MCNTENTERFCALIYNTLMIKTDHVFYDLITTRYRDVRMRLINNCILTTSTSCATKGVSPEDEQQTKSILIKVFFIIRARFVRNMHAA